MIWVNMVKTSTLYFHNQISLYEFLFDALQKWIHLGKIYGPPYCIFQMIIPVESCSEMKINEDPIYHIFVHE